eukprot:CAMPEP_0178447180 /NCGR_PEP_ID=MMETSP0689_2-20121128/41238_1 /TAXON_ID=160604 /ORGANISM="Amphidinium massartii, Strain CS-259" /LENGTH=799 /DNA_ID=CAMNT_0020072131 /DNA_START=48 /DNA_END=2447 /DNA_ORIENTATION=+
MPRSFRNRDSGGDSNPLPGLPEEGTHHHMHPMPSGDSLNGTESGQMPDPRLLGVAAAMAAPADPSSSQQYHRALPDQVDQAMPPRFEDNRTSDVEGMMLTYGMMPDKVENQEDWRDISDLRPSTKAVMTSKGCRGYCEKLCTSIQFQATIGVLIVLNAITMGLEVDSDGSTADLFHVVESVFTIIFFIEVLIRFAGSTPERPVRKDWQLIFDTMIVLVTMIDNWILYYVNNSGSGGDSGFDLSVLMLLRLLRLARILRIFRAITVFRPMRVLLATLANAAQTLFWTMILLLVVFYCFGLTFRMLFESASKTETINRIVDKYFASLWDCLLTQFEILLGGFDWYTEITWPLIHSEDHVLLSTVWLLFLCVVNLCVANVIIGVFVEQLLLNAKESDDQLSREVFVNQSANLADLRTVFKEIDLNKRGFITSEEFQQGVRDHPRLADLLNIDKDEADIFFNALDLQSRGVVKVDDFIFGIVKLKGGTKSVDMLSFDYQVKQIIRLVQKSPQRIDELHIRMGRFESSLEQLWREMDASHQAANSELPAMGERMAKLEQQIDSFMSGLLTSTSHAGGGGGGGSGGGQVAAAAALMNGGGAGKPAISLTNLKESYALADEMREIRRVMLLATRAANGERMDLNSLPQLERPGPNREDSDTDRALLMTSIPSMTQPPADVSRPQEDDPYAQLAQAVAGVAKQGPPQGSSRGPPAAAPAAPQTPPRQARAKATPRGASPPQVRSGSPGVPSERRPATQQPPSRLGQAPPASQAGSAGAGGASQAMQRLEEAMGALLPMTSLRNQGRV